MQKNIILADCEYEEIVDFVRGLKKETNDDYVCECKELTNHGWYNNLYRYLMYFIFPMKFFLCRSQYNYILGWQQFFVLLFAGYCRLFHVKKENKVIAMNFTYKKKNGVVGCIYDAFMMFCVKNSYLDYIHVLSYNYASYCTKELKIPREKIIVTPFGLPDTYEQWKNSKVSYKNFWFSIGRSNRDFQFLVDAWRKMPLNELLIIASDTFTPKGVLPDNVIHRTDISGDDQFPYIANCKGMIIPIKDGNVCSGDTVLLKAMSYKKAVVVTKPSTLAEMYIDDNINGILVEKNEDDFCKKIKALTDNCFRLKDLGENARIKYQEKYSRFQMGKSIGKQIYN